VATSVSDIAESMDTYLAYWEKQRKQNARLADLAAGMALFSKVPTTLPESSSRQDARIALLMRAEGHSREAVTDVIWRCAPELRGEEKRDWRRYAARTAAYAFGVAGDMELAKMPRMERRPEEQPPPLPPPPAPPHPDDERQRETPRLRMR
jgi:hypothetical protein